MKRLTNNGYNSCVVCETAMDDKNHSHIVRTYIKFEGDTEVTQVVGVVCCVCVSRLSARQVPSPYREEQGQNALKESAPVPFTPQIDWGRIEEMRRLKKLTKNTATAKRRSSKATQKESPAW